MACKYNDDVDEMPANMHTQRERERGIESETERDVYREGTMSMPYALCIVVAFFGCLPFTHLSLD